MSGQRKHMSTSASGFSDSTAKKAKRLIAITTVRKWQRELNNDHATMTWLKFEIDEGTAGRVSSMYCDVCRTYKDNIQGMRNFSNTWLAGSTNFRVSSVVDHAKSEQHKNSMSRLHSEPFRGRLPVATTPILSSLYTMNDKEKAQMCRKFEICYVLAREGLPYSKYPEFNALASRQGVDIGFAYKTSDSAKNFTHFIAASQRQRFLDSLNGTKFFSFMVDGSTDAGNVEQELVFVLYCYIDHKSRQISSCTRYLGVVSPESANTEGILKCLDTALDRVGISLQDKKSVLNSKDRPALVGCGTDGASVNIGVHHSVKAHLQSKYNWLFWAWCFSHRLELACKDACSGKLFSEISEMLLRLYYLYEKSSKKSRELASIAEDLQEVFHIPSGGRLPVRCSGTRWISHKRKALLRVIDCYGMYISHIIALSQDSTTKPADKAKLTGYIKKWVKAKMLIGCAMYIDILKAPSLLSLTLQKDSIDIIYCIKQILKSLESLDTLSKQDPKEWPTVSLVFTRISDCNSEDDADGQPVYQGANLSHYNGAFSTCSRQAKADLLSLSESVKKRLAWSDLKLLRSILAFLDTGNWAIKGHVVTQQSDSEQDEDLEDDKKEIKEAVDYICSVFREPLEAKDVCCASMFDELEEIVDYCRCYLDVLEDYRRVWYQLHTTSEATRWPNVIAVSQLLFSLPFTNSVVERGFSTMKLLKTEKRTRLLTSTLDELMEIKLEGPNPENLSANDAVQLWYNDRARRPCQSTRKDYRPRAGSSSPSSTSTSVESVSFSLEEWDQLFVHDESDTDSDS